MSEEKENQIVPINPMPVEEGEDFKVPLVVNQRPMELAMIHKLFADAYISNFGKITPAIRQVEDEIGRPLDAAKAKRFLDYPEVKAYLAERLKQFGISQSITREQWEQETLEFRDGKRQADKTTCFMHKLLGLSRGFISSGGNSTFVKNQQIVFKESE